MNTKLLCIDSLEDYELIDRDLLYENGVEVFFASKKPYKERASPQYLSIRSFDYEELYCLCEIIKLD
jgi:hypothetical protein